MATDFKRMVKLTVPAAYVEDFQLAVMRELKSDHLMFDTNTLTLEQARKERPSRPDHIECCEADRDSGVDAVLRTSRLLAQVAATDAGLPVSAQVQDLGWVLDELGRIWAQRLAERWDYGPADVESVPPLLERLQWCTEQAIAMGDH